MVAYPQRITLCGFGGQGIILSAVILGTTAVTKGDLYAVQTQSYGSEARGGQCQAELIIDKKAINSPVAEKKNLLVAMFQTAYEKYIPTLEEDGVLVIDPGSCNESDPSQLRIRLKYLQRRSPSISETVWRQTWSMLGFLSEALGIIRASGSSGCGKGYCKSPVCGAEL